MFLFCGGEGNWGLFLYGYAASVRRASGASAPESCLLGNISFPLVILALVRCAARSMENASGRVPRGYVNFNALVPIVLWITARYLTRLSTSVQLPFPAFGADASAASESRVLTSVLPGKRFIRLPPATVYRPGCTWMWQGTCNCSCHALGVDLTACLNCMSC